MRNRDYTKEIGLAAAERPVPIAATTAIFVAVVVLGLLFARQVNALQTVVAETSTPAPVKVSSR